MPNWHIVTPRLILRTATLEDVEAIFSGWASDPAATCYMSWARHVDRLETRAFVDHCMRQWSLVSIGPCVIELRQSGQLIGGSGLSLASDPKVAEIGYILTSSCWGYGFATETVRALIKWAQSLQLQKLHASVHPHNAASMNVLYKCGFTQDHCVASKIRFPNLASEEPVEALSFSLELQR